jgi:hypothetical protein
LDDTKLKLGGCHQREFAADGGAGNGRPPVHRTLQGIDLDLGAGASLVEMDAEAVYPLPHRITYMEITDAAGAIIDEWSCCKAPLVVCTPSVSLERCSRRRPVDLVFRNVDRFDDRQGASRTLPNMRPTLGANREPTITSRLQPHQTDEIEKRRAATKQPPASSLIQPTPM